MSADAESDRTRQPLKLVDSALFCEMVFGGVVMLTLWLVIWAVYGVTAFILSVLVAFGAAACATGFSLLVARRYANGS